MHSDPQVSSSETGCAVTSKQGGETAHGTDSAAANELSETRDPSSAGKGFLRPAYFALLIAVLVAVGSYSILPVWVYMSRIWLNDPLRAIGAVFPLLAFAGTVVAWRRLGWSLNGSFWGLPLLVVSILLARLTSSLILVYRIHQHDQPVLHPGVVMFLYGVGAVLLFGGPRLLRAAIAPLCLLLLVDPVPHLFNTLVDLPLQFLSANTARHFAHLIGLQPTGEQLRMMFTPDFGMMIVPGCNGVRGSVTLGYLALIFGYIRHLRPRRLALTALGAFLMGYVLNLLRLCILVIYYRIGVNVPSIQPYGAGVDYGIGCTLFLFATLAVGLFIRWLEPEPRAQTTDAAFDGSKAASSNARLGFATVARTVCFLVLTLVFIVPMLSAGNSLHVTPPSEQALLASFPAQVGPYRLIRTYDELAANGLIQFALADYSAPTNNADAASTLTLGLYVGAGRHLVAYSRFAQGIQPDWIGSLDTADASAYGPMKVHLVTTLYDDGIRREFNAETVCYETGCSADIDSEKSRLFVSAPKLSDVVSGSSSNHLAILLRREWPDSDSRSTVMLRSQFEDDARQFTEHLNLRKLLHDDGVPI
jgi:exosortase J